MKKIILIFLVGLFLFSGGIIIGATTREKLYRKFGPMLIEAIVRVVKNEINILRAEVGLPERTNEQLLNAIDNELEGLEIYDWMNQP